MKIRTKKLSASTLLLLSLAMAGCASAPPLPGAPQREVLTRLGKPSAVYSVQNDTVLEYATGPFGQFTYMARIGPDDRLMSYEQVLTDAKFATVKVGVTNKEDVLHTFGRPAETSYLSWQKLEVWTYRYKQSDVWDAMMHVHFDDQGVLRMMQSGPDEYKERLPFFR